MAYDASLYFLNLLFVSCVTLPIYYLLKSVQARQILLILLGTYALYTVAPRLLLYWPPYWLIIWGFAALLSRIKPSYGRSILFFVGLGFALLPMSIWKFLPVIFPQEINRLLHSGLISIAPFLKAPDEFSSWLVPIGLSFSTFRALDYLICTQLNLLPRAKLREVLSYGLFAPVLIVGPIIQFQEFQQASAKTREDISQHIALGAIRILTGFFKLFVLALPLSGSAQVIGDFEFHPVSLVWLNVFIYSWYLYLNFSGYSDIAIGTASLYGFKLRENFRFPYFRRNLQEFWANWHMSLTSFAQRNVFVPLGGFRKEKQYLATVATMMVIALWHDFTMTLITFGICHSFVLVVLRLTQRSKVAPSSSPMRRVLSTITTYAFVAVTIPLLLLKDSDMLSFYYYLVGGTP